MQNACWISRRPWLGGVLAILGLVVCLLLDQWVYEKFGFWDHDYDMGSEDWYRALRILGSFSTWLVVALIFGCIDWGRRKQCGATIDDVLFRPTLLLITVFTSGIVAEVLKVVFRRERPHAGDDTFVFRSFADQWYRGGGLSMPSSHAAAAFAALVLMGIWYRSARSIFFLLAVGCGVTRIIAGAHFLSDVYVAAWLGGGVTVFYCRWLTKDKVNPLYVTDGA